MSRGFHEQLAHSWATTGSRLCVGLDPDPDRFPEPLVGAPHRVAEFCEAIIDATADQACAFKPQIAYFAAQGAEPALERVCGYIRDRYPDHTLILDAKRGDIGPTAKQYAVEAFDRYQAHAVTVNPYLGTDSAEPFLERGGVIALCRTSNPGSDELQALIVDGEPLFLKVARMVSERWSELGDCGLVTGATYPDELAVVRSAAPTLPFLIPGVGAQGGDVTAAVRGGLTADGSGVLVSSSRAVLYASSGDDFAEAARRAASETANAARG